MPEPLDRRLNAYRDDLADVRLEGLVVAERFVEGQAYHVTATIVPVHPRPSHDSALDTEALKGEIVRVFEIANGWAWAQLEGDGYVGYIPADMIGAGQSWPATHVITSPQVFAYTTPNGAAKPSATLLLGTAFAAIGESDDFLVLAEDGFVGKRHTASLGATEPDYIVTALSMLNAPYLWGGKSVHGLDCSGLVQLSLQRAGIKCPRDTDMQKRQLLGDLELGDDILDKLQRGDIVYWPGHVGIMIDSENMVHASGTLMATGIEPVAAVAERSRKGGPVVSAVKRFA